MSASARLTAVRVWRLQLDTINVQQAALEKILSPDELTRSKRFHFDRDRRRYVATRAVLRSILGMELDCEPADVTLRYGPFGKPGLADEGKILRFNVSHSHEFALIAVTLGREIGVDVEFVRRMADLESLLSRNFSPREIAAFQSLSPEQREHAFFTGWTRKEAYLKALGGGLSIPLDRFSVSLAPGEPPALVETLDEPAARDRWMVADVPMPAGYVAAIVAERQDWRLECLDWSF